MSWSTAFVQTTESSRNLNYRGTQLQDQLSRFQFTQTKLPFLNQLGISFEKPRTAWAGAFPAVLQWEVEQWPGSVNNSVCEGLPSDRHIQLLQVPLRVSLDLSANVLLPAWAAQSLELLQNSKKEQPRSFPGPWKCTPILPPVFLLLPYLPWCVCCKNPPALQSYQGIWISVFIELPFPGKARQVWSWMSTTRFNQVLMGIMLWHH